MTRAAPPKNWPNELKTLSRTRSEVGRTPLGTGARRVPRAVPAMIRKRLPHSRKSQSTFAPRSSLISRLRGRVGPLEGGILGDEGERFAPGLHQEVHVAQELSDLQVRHAALATPEERPLAPDREVHLRELEAVLVSGQGLQALLGVLSLRVGDQKAHRGVETPEDPAPQLVELREAEALGALDHDRARVRHVNADLDDDRGNEDLDLPGAEIGHDVPLVRRPHATVQEPYAPVRENLGLELVVELLRGAHVLQRLRFFDERTDHVRLPPGFELPAHLIVGFVALG